MLSSLRSSKNAYLQGAVFLANLFLRQVQHQFARRSLARKKPFRGWDFAARKSSHTLFVLASGASIAALSREQLAEIRRHDSVGFNFWLLHQLVPTYLVVEFLPDSDRSEHLWQNLAGRAADYAEVPVIFKYSPTLARQVDRIPDALGCISLSHHLSIPGESRAGLARWLRLLDRAGLLSGRLPRGVMLFRQASLSWLLVFALRLGYRNIVFCGADLNTPRYFFEVDDTFPRSRGLSLPPREFATASHPTNIAGQCAGGVTIEEVLALFAEEVLARHGVCLFLGSSSSALYPRFPLYPWTAG